MFNNWKQFDTTTYWPKSNLHQLHYSQMPNANLVRLSHKHIRDTSAEHQFEGATDTAAQTSLEVWLVLLKRRGGLFCCHVSVQMNVNACASVYETINDRNVSKTEPNIFDARLSKHTFVLPTISDTTCCLWPIRIINGMPWILNQNQCCVPSDRPLIKLISGCCKTMRICIIS